MTGQVNECRPLKSLLPSYSTQVSILLLAFFVTPSHCPHYSNPSPSPSSSFPLLISNHYHHYYLLYVFPETRSVLAFSPYLPCCDYLSIDARKGLICLTSTQTVTHTHFIRLSLISNLLSYSQNFYCSNHFGFMPASPNEYRILAL